MPGPYCGYLYSQQGVPLGSVTDAHFFVSVCNIDVGLKDPALIHPTPPRGARGLKTWKQSRVGGLVHIHSLVLPAGHYQGQNPQGGIHGAIQGAFTDPEKARFCSVLSLNLANTPPAEQTCTLTCLTHVAALQFSSI